MSANETLSEPVVAMRAPVGVRCLPWPKVVACPRKSGRHVSPGGLEASQLSAHPRVHCDIQRGARRCAHPAIETSSEHRPVDRGRPTVRIMRAGTSAGLPRSTSGGHGASVRRARARPIDKPRMWLVLFSPSGTRRPAASRVGRPGAVRPWPDAPGHGQSGNRQFAGKQHGVPSYLGSDENAMATTGVPAAIASNGGRPNPS